MQTLSALKNLVKEEAPKARTFPTHQGQRVCLVKSSSFPSCCSESHFLLGISKATCWLSNVWFQMKLLLDEATSGWCYLASLVFFAQWSVHKTTPKKWEKVCFSSLRAGQKTQHVTSTCFSSKAKQLPVSCCTFSFTFSPKTKTWCFFDCLLVRGSKHPHVFCLNFDGSKQHLL